jgi:hypothetical protein
MKVKALKVFYHDRLGKVGIGQEVDLPKDQVDMYLEKKAVEVYSTKVAEPKVEAVKETVEAVKATKVKAK